MVTGLDGVVAAETRLSEVDGSRGSLLLRGLPLRELAGLSYLGMAAHLWHDLISEQELCPEVLSAALGQARCDAWAVAIQTGPRTRRMSPIDGLRSGLAALSPHPRLPLAVQITGAVPVLIASQQRLRHGLEPLDPDPSRTQGDDFLRMLRGVVPDPAEAAALDTYLVTVAEHGMNASTFTARVIASTGSDAISACVGALGALKGPLHGGAPGPVLDMLDEIRFAEAALPWVEASLQAGKRLMGFGHRVYKVRDPRADVLRGALFRLAPDSPRLALALAVEQAAVQALAVHKPGQKLFTNVEFFTALLLEALGLPRSLFTPVFALGRVLGWNAHILEQAQHGRLMRPKARYVGPRPAVS